MLSDLQQFLKDQDNVNDKDQVKLFVSKKAIDELLSGLNDTTVELPNTNGARLTVKNIKSEFNVGFPSLAVDAFAEKSGGKVAANLVARLEAYVDSSRPDELSLGNSHR